MRILSSVHPNAGCNTAVRDGVSKCIEENAGCLFVIVGLGHESVSPGCYLLPANTIDIAIEETCHVFKETATCAESWKVRMGYTGAARRWNRRQANLHVLSISTQSRL